MSIFPHISLHHCGYEGDDFSSILTSHSPVPFSHQYTCSYFTDRLLFLLLFSPPQQSHLLSPQFTGSPRSPQTHRLGALVPAIVAWGGCAPITAASVCFLGGKHKWSSSIWPGFIHYVNILIFFCIFPRVSQPTQLKTPGGNRTIHILSNHSFHPATSQKFGPPNEWSDSAICASHNFVPIFVSPKERVVSCSLTSHLSDHMVDHLLSLVADFYYYFLLLLLLLLNAVEMEKFIWGASLRA